MEGHTNRQVIFAQRPTGLPNVDTDFRLETTAVPALNEGEVLTKTLYLSVDPYMRGRMKDVKSYAAGFVLGKPLEGGGVSQVVASKNEAWKVGDVLETTTRWQDYNVYPAAALQYARKLDSYGLPLSTALGVLGMPGMTAYLGLTKIGAPKAGETLVVSGAAGAVGSLVGQIGKILGLKVIGIAGGADKVKFIKEELGFDVGIDYKATSDMTAAIAEAAPQGVDIYFDNVGGSIADSVILNLNRFARVALCGAISGYNATEVELGPRLNWIFISRSVTLQGFIVSQWLSDWPAGLQQMGHWIKEGKIKFHETVRKGLENTPKAFVELLTGDNTGKMVVHVADPEKTN